MPSTLTPEEMLALGFSPSTSAPGSYEPAVRCTFCDFKDISCVVQVFNRRLQDQQPRIKKEVRSPAAVASTLVPTSTSPTGDDMVTALPGEEVAMTQNDEHATELEFTFVRPMIFNHSPRSIGERACTPSLWHFGREAGSDSRSPDQGFPLLAELPLSPGLSPFLWTHLSPDMENEGRRDHSPSSLRDGEAANRLLAVEDIEPALEMPSIGEAVASQDMEGADASPVSVAKRLEDSPEGGRQKHQPLVLHLDRGTGTGDDAAVLDWSSDSSLTEMSITEEDKASTFRFGSKGSNRIGNSAVVGSTKRKRSARQAGLSLQLPKSVKRSAADTTTPKSVSTRSRSQTQITKLTPNDTGSLPSRKERNTVDGKFSAATIPRRTTRVTRSSAL